MNVIFVNSIEPACGVHQFGLNLWRILEQSPKFQFHYCAPGSNEELLAALDKLSGTGVPPVLPGGNSKDNSKDRLEACPTRGIVFWNYYPCTMPWVSLQTLLAVRQRGWRQPTIFHEVPVTGFDAYLNPDPTFKDGTRRLNPWFGLGRPLAPRRHSARVRVRREVPVIGTSGFGFGNKGYVRLVEQVLKEFARARIRLHLPFAKHGDDEGKGAMAVAEECRKLVGQASSLSDSLGRQAGSAVPLPGIDLEIDHDFLSPDDYLAWLAENDLNAFLYDEMPGRGIASTIDHALAVPRPIAITRTTMMRHLHGCTPSICIEDHSLTEILEQGLAPLEPIYRKFSDEAMRGRVEEILEKVSGAEPVPGAECQVSGQKPDPSHLTPRTSQPDTSHLTPRTYCRLLTNVDRVAYAPLIAELTAAAPEMMARKIPEANVQQAFCLDVVRRAAPKSVLCVGCFEDTAFETLRVNSGTGVPPVCPHTFDQVEHCTICEADRLEACPTITGIDPAIPGSLDLHTFRQRNLAARFDCVFACSVLEHVADDEQFVRDMCDALVPDGVGIITCDFQAAYRPGDPLPATNVRFYTPSDIERLGQVLERRSGYWLVGQASSLSVGKGKDRLEACPTTPDFTYQGHHYSFLGLVFKKL